MEFIKYRPGHLDFLDNKEIFERDLELVEKNMGILEGNDQAHAVTLLHDGKVMAIFGIVLKWKGVGEVWSVTSKHVKDYPLAFHRAVLKLIDEYAGGLQLHRMEMVVRGDYIEGLEWSQALGFKIEGLMKGFSQHREDYWQMGRCW